jgi:MerR family transcriptional regulator, thiopeptide resistance regulator
LGDYTVKQVAKLSGVSVRTLHHYDELGLLKPASVGANGYRYYGRDELLRLQQILFHRELGLSLAEIGQVMDAPDFDRHRALRAHRDKLAADVKRYRRLMQTIDQTLAALEGERQMDDKDLYAGFAPEKQAEYEAWLVDRHGEPMKDRIEQSKARMKGWSGADFASFKADGEATERAFAKALTEGLPADSDAAQALAARWAGWIEKAWGRKPTRESFIGLGRMYGEHPDFQARFEALAPGLTEYLAEAMRVYAERKL